MKKDKVSKVLVIELVSAVDWSGRRKLLREKVTVPLAKKRSVP
jgi:hypothetical protein